MHFRKLQLKKYEEEVRRQSEMNSNQPQAPIRVDHSESPRTPETGTRTVKSLKSLAMNRIIDPGLKHKTAYFKNLREKELAMKAKIAEQSDASQSIDPVAQKSEIDPTTTVDSKSQNDATTSIPAEDLKTSRISTPAEDHKSVASTSRISVLRYAPPSIESVAQKSENDPTQSVDSKSQNEETAEDLGAVPSTSQNAGTTTTSEEPQSEVEMEEIFQTQAKLMDLLNDLKTVAMDVDEVDEKYPYVSPLNPNEAIIGPKYTTVDVKKLMAIDWTRSASIIVRKILMICFDRDTLATHNLTGKPSPSFLEFDMPEKKPLDPDVVSDIIFFMRTNFGTREKEVRHCITNKCADESKLLRCGKRKKMVRKSNNTKAKPY